MKKKRKLEGGKKKEDLNNENSIKNIEKEEKKVMPKRTRVTFRVRGRKVSFLARRRRKVRKIKWW